MAKFEVGNRAAEKWTEETKIYTLDELKKKLTDKERIFCHEYIIKWNGAESARKAGYSEDCAKETAYENLTKPHIKQYIDFIKDDIEKEAGITKLSQVKAILSIAGGEESSDRDKLSAMAELNKMLGYNAPEKHEGTTVNYNAEVSKEEAKKISDALENEV